MAERKRVSSIWRGIALLLIGALLGTGAGVALGFFLFPYVFPPPPATDTLTQEEKSKLLARGEFIQANPFDPVHYGKGRVSVYETVVFLESDFEVGPGPKFHVYLVPKTPVRQSAHVEDTMFVDLGRLRSFKGAQKYRIPTGINVREYPSVVIWCERFNVLISPADLEFVMPAPSG